VIIIQFERVATNETLGLGVGLSLIVNKECKEEYCDASPYVHCRNNRYNRNGHFHDNEYVEIVELPQRQIVATNCC
jgi:hypothetical protein